jgi:hypothetical protein
LTPNIPTAPDILRGALIYGGGDTIAALLLGEFLWTRLIGMALVGGLLYATEIPAWFRWIDHRYPTGPGRRAQLQRTGLAVAWFNPLWIARHLAFIALFSADWPALDWGLLDIGLRAFVANVPVVLLANWAIQNHLPYRRRFIGSALFSAAMAIYYALSRMIFA